MASRLTAALMTAGMNGPGIASAVSYANDVPGRIQIRAANATSQHGNGATDSTDLPIDPHFNPAFTVAGILLFFTGIPYLLVGFRNKRLQVFFSACYLTSLAIIVLILYLVTPPTSNALQGAYLVAAAIPGFIVGAVSLLVINFAEGLGCLLGGFCLSMWILVLSPGGLIRDSVARAIFIGVLTATSFAPSFSRYTKEYALIGFTSFSGSTATILGVDFISRAGLKEFWLYLWALNDEYFPPESGTYPITPGMKAEIALIFVISAGGIISQLKLWKMVKDRRKKRSVLLENDPEQSEMEENHLRRLGEAAGHERIQWQRLYRQSHSDRGFVSTVVDTMMPSPQKTYQSIYQAKEISVSSEDMGAHPIDRTARSRNQAVGRRDITSDDILPVHRGNEYASWPQSDPGRSSSPPPPPPPPKDWDTNDSATTLISIRPKRKPVPSEPLQDSGPGEIITDASESSRQVRRAFSFESQPDENDFMQLFAPDQEVNIPPTQEAYDSSDRESESEYKSRSMTTLSESASRMLAPVFHLDQHATSAEIINAFCGTPEANPQDCYDSEPLASAVQVYDVNDDRRAAATKEDPVPVGNDIITAEEGKPARAGRNSLPSQKGRAQDVSVQDGSPGPSKSFRLRRGAFSRRRKYRSNDEPQFRNGSSLRGRLQKPKPEANPESVAPEPLISSRVAQVPSQNGKILAAQRTDEWANDLTEAERPDIGVPMQPSDSDEYLNRTSQETSSTNPSQAREEFPRISNGRNKLQPRRSQKKGSRANESEVEALVETLRTLRKEATGDAIKEIDSMLAQLRPLKGKPSPQPGTPKQPVQSSRNARPRARPHPGLASRPLFRQGSSAASIRPTTLNILSQSLANSPIDETSEASFPSRSRRSPRVADPEQSLPSSQRSSNFRSSGSSSWSASLPSSATSMPSGETPGPDHRWTSSDSDATPLTDRKPVNTDQRHASSQEYPRKSSNGLLFDPSRPRNFSQPFSTYKRDISTDWREPLRPDRSSKEDSGIAVSDGRYPIFPHQRNGSKRQEPPDKYKKYIVDQSMKTGNFNQLHKEAMRRMQAKANANM